MRVDRVDYLEAQGPTYARHRAELLLRDEDFVLQIDTHMIMAER